MYLRLENDQVAEYPFSLERLKELYPNRSFPKNPTVSMLNSVGIHIVVSVDEPAHDKYTEVAVESVPVFNIDKSQWERSYSLRPISPEELDNLLEKDQQRAEEEAVAQVRADTKADVFVQQFVNMTSEQVIAYVNANVANLADAKQLLTKIALMMLAIAKEQYK